MCRTPDTPNWQRWGRMYFDFLIEKMLILPNVVATIVDMHVWNSFINK